MSAAGRRGDVMLAGGWDSRRTGAWERETMLGWLVLIACLIFFYKVGELEHSSGLIMALISFAVWIGTSALLTWGLLGCILTQIGLFALLTVVNVVRHRPGKERRIVR
jgi:hypothetical protein